MNWAIFAIGVGLISAAAITLAAMKGQGSKAGRLLAIPLLMVVTSNGAAPVRALTDSTYVGYSFGLLSSERGLPVTLMAGGIIVAALVAAYVAVSHHSGRILLVPAVVSAGLATNLGIPLFVAAVRDPVSYMIQLGEYLTIPGLLALGLIFLVLILPFALGAIWFARGAMTRRSAGPEVES